MLVLGRKLGERILVPHCQLTLTVVAIEGNKVKLGITAPTDVDVYREELWRKLRAEKVAPQSFAGPDTLTSGDGAN
jgi:carbon storage regulator